MEKIGENTKQMKKRLSILLAMTVLAASLPGAPTRAAGVTEAVTAEGEQPEEVQYDVIEGEISEIAEIQDPGDDSSDEVLIQGETGEIVESENAEAVDGLEEPENSEIPGAMESHDNIEASESTESTDVIETPEPTESICDTETPESTEAPEDSDVKDIGYPSDIVSEEDFSAIEEIGLFQIPSVRETDTVQEITVSNATELIAAAKKVNGLATEEFAGIYNITLTENIDLSKAETESWPGFGTFDHPFNGSFNGQNHTVTLADKSTGLIHYAEKATIQNITVKSAGSVIPAEISVTAKQNGQDVEISKNYAASIVVYMKGGTVQNCGNLAKIDASDADAAGGVIGYARNYDYNVEGSVTIYDCWNGATVDGGTYAGGVIGELDRVGTANTMKMYGCNNYGTVNGVNAGGIAGLLTDNVNVHDVYNGGSVNGTKIASGLVGQITGTAQIIRAVNGGKVFSENRTVNPVYQYTGSKEEDDVHVENVCYDSTLNPDTYTWNAGGVTGKTTEKFATGSAIDYWGAFSTDGDGGSRDWRKNAGSYPICVKNDKNQVSTFPEQAIRAATDTAYIVTDGADTYLCLTNYGENNYTKYGSDTLQQFSNINVTEGNMSLTYSEDGYERDIPLTKSGNMTVIYGNYDNSLLITLDGTFAESSSYYQDTVYNLPYGTKIDATATLTGKTDATGLLLQSGDEEQSQDQDENQGQSPAQETIKWKLVSQTPTELNKINLTQNNTDGSSSGKLTGQIDVTPSAQTYTITIAAEKKTQVTSWCVKKIQVKVVKAAVEFEWKVNGNGSTSRDAVYNNNPYTVEADRTDNNDYTGLSVEPKVNIIYRIDDKNSENNENSKLPEAPKNAGNYTVEMQPDAGTTDYYTYFCPENVSFTINPKELINPKASGQSGYTIDLARNEIIIEEIGWKTEDTQNTVTIQDDTLNQRLASGTDYTVTYTNNSEPGIATVTIEGKGNYYTKQPIVLTYPIKEVLSADMFHFTDPAKTTVILGKDSETNLPVTGTGKMTRNPLTEGEDYTVSYADTDRPGTATVTITGGTNGKYIIKENEPVTLQYRVKKLLTKDMFVLENTDPVTLGEGKEQKKLIGTDAEFRPQASLVEDKDYTLIYSGTDRPGTATVTVQTAENSDYVTDQDHPIQFRYNIMLGSSKAELDTGSYKLGNPGMWYLKEQPDVHYYGEIDFYVPNLKNYQFFHVEE